VVLISSHPKAHHWGDKVERRLREEIAKISLTINEEKSRRINFDQGQPFDFLGYTFRLVSGRTNNQKKFVLAHPQKKKQTKFLRDTGYTLQKCLAIPVKKVVKEILNPRLRGWVEYFKWGNSGKELQHVRWQIDMKIRKFASRQRPKRRGGRRWTKWRTQEIYEDWGLFNDYHVSWCSSAKG
jgi:RNA-directed DNA polymerase